jgi:hypothetical protein
MTYDLLETCELVLTPDFPQLGTFSVYYNGPEGFNLTSLGQNVTTSIGISLYPSTGARVHIYYMVLHFSSSSQLYINSHAEIEASSITRSVPADTFLLNIYGELMVKDATLISSADNQAALYVSGSMLCLRCLASTPDYFVSSPPGTKIFLIETQLNGSLLSYNRPDTLVIQDSQIQTSLIRSFVRGTPHRFSIIRSLIESPPQGLGDPWASTAESSESLEIIESTILGMNLVIEPQNFLIESSLISHSLSGPIIDGSVANLTIRNSTLRRTSTSTPSLPALSLGRAPRMLDLTWDSSTLDGLSPVKGDFMFPQTTRFFHDLSLPSCLISEYSPSYWNATDNTVHFTDFLVSEAAGGDGTLLELSGKAFIFDSINVTDVGFSSHVETTIIYRATDLNAGCISQIGQSTLAVHIGSGKLLVDLSVADVHTLDKLPMVGDEYPLFDTSQSDLNVTDVSGIFNLSYHLRSSNQGRFSFGAVTCNSSCVLEHLDGDCVHPSLCRCLSEWSGPLCDCPTSRWIGEACEPSPTAEPEPEPVSHSSPLIDSSASLLFSICVFGIVTLII